MTTEEDDNFSKAISEMDQLGEAIKLISPLLSGYLKSLVKEGFTRSEAMQLTIELQKQIFPNNNQRSNQ